LLTTIFSNAVFGNSVVAIAAGVVAQLVADFFGYVAPFDCALVVLTVMGVVAIYTWPENYGDSTAAVHQSFVDALRVIRDGESKSALYTKPIFLTQDRKVFGLGLVQSLFEGSMYMFVLEWTPALGRAVGPGGSIPHGYTFASFMLCVMMGSTLFRMSSQRGIRPEQSLIFVLLIAAGALAAPILMPENVTAVFIAFNLFEICVGYFWPAMCFLRSQYVPEETRLVRLQGEV